MVFKMGAFRCCLGIKKQQANETPPANGILSLIHSDRASKKQIIYVDHSEYDLCLV
jgi:hypothetical protein